MNAIIKVEFTMDFTPDEKGKCTSNVRFSLPEHPDLKVPDKVKRGALEQVGMLCNAILTHPDGFPG